jgi:hypothetical protein
MPKAGDITVEGLDSDKITAQIKGIFYDIEKYKQLLAQKAKVLISKAEQNDKLLDEQLDIIRRRKK